MCGISGITGAGWEISQLESMVDRQAHRGPDARKTFRDATQTAGLGHNRLSIIDLSAGGLQPMASHDQNLQIVFNGEIYNYLELRAELSEYPFRSRSDTEVILAAYQRWGEACLDRFIGMFAFLIWDQRARRLFAARDRFGVKPLYYSHQPDGLLILASEIKSIFAAGIVPEPDATTWAGYLASGLYDHSEKTFWEGIYSLPAGHYLTWQEGRICVKGWYDLAASTGEDYDNRPIEVVGEEYSALLKDSVRLRFRSDVPVGINLSGGLDSSVLLGLVQAVQGIESNVKAFTFVTGDPDYDESPWVDRMLEHTRHPSITCRLSPEDVPALAESVQWHEDEPFGGLPTLAYARLFERARAEGAVVLLDGQGMDEQWAGYDYYRGLDDATPAPLIQGSLDRAVRPECLTQEFRRLASDFEFPQPFHDKLRNTQLRDARFTKIPRALRFNDRISMRVSTELREPFLDHRLLELAFRQPPQRKINGGVSKWMLRRIAGELIPGGVVGAPKRPIQTPQREWLRGPLRDWANYRIEEAVAIFDGSWLDGRSLREVWHAFCQGQGDNSFFIWQWISLGLMFGRNQNKA